MSQLLQESAEKLPVEENLVLKKAHEKNVLLLANNNTLKSSELRQLREQ